jgi:L-ascorbate metabolism protein UlaG (beta-lactamase superfamily)
MFDAFEFADITNAKIAIMVHYDKLGANPNVYKAFAERFNKPFKLVTLDFKQEYLY